MRLMCPARSFTLIGSSPPTLNSWFFAANARRFCDTLGDARMGMTPELAIALLACARIGAVHSVIFGGFAANAIADRVNDSSCVAILTQDSSYRRGGEIKLKQTVDEAMKACPTVEHVVVYRRTGSPVDMVDGPRLVVARPDRQRARRVPSRAARLRRSVVYPLHLRHHR